MADEEVPPAELAPVVDSFDPATATLMLWVAMLQVIPLDLEHKVRPIQQPDDEVGLIHLRISVEFIQYREFELVVAGVTLYLAILGKHLELNHRSQLPGTRAHTGVTCLKGSRPLLRRATCSKPCGNAFSSPSSVAERSTGGSCELYSYLIFGLSCIRPCDSSPPRGMFLRLVGYLGTRPTWPMSTQQ